MLQIFEFIFKFLHKLFNFYIEILFAGFYFYCCGLEDLGCFGIFNLADSYSCFFGDLEPFKENLFDFKDF